MLFKARAALLLETKYGINFACKIDADVVNFIALWTDSLGVVYFECLK